MKSWDSITPDHCGGSRPARHSSPRPPSPQRPRKKPIIRLSGAVEIPWIGPGRNGDIEPAEHHLVPALLSPAHILGRIGIAWIVRRIIEMRRALDAGTFRHHHRLFKGVVKLP